MRTLFIVFLIFLAGSHSSFAQSLLRVRLADNSRFRISVNGRHFNRQGTAITVGDLPPGKHYLKIFSIARDRWGSGYERTIYQGDVYTNYRMTTQFVYDPYTHRVSIKDLPADRGMTDARNQDNSLNRANYNDGSENDDSRESGTIGGNQSQGAVASPVAASSLSDAESERLKKRVGLKKTDTEKLTLIKETLKGETLSTFQVGTIMEWLLFESSRVEFAKWAYDITTDKESYEGLSEKFDYKNSKDELRFFLKKR